MGEYTHRLTVTTAPDDELTIMGTRPGLDAGGYAVELATRLTKGAGLYGPDPDGTWVVIPGHAIAYVHVQALPVDRDDQPTYTPVHAQPADDTGGEPPPVGTLAGQAPASDVPDAVQPGAAA